MPRRSAISANLRSPRHQAGDGIDRHRFAIAVLKLSAPRNSNTPSPTTRTKEAPSCSTSSPTHPKTTAPIQNRSVFSTLLFQTRHSPDSPQPRHSDSKGRNHVPLPFVARSALLERGETSESMRLLASESPRYFHEPVRRPKQACGNRVAIHPAISLQAGFISLSLIDFKNSRPTTQPVGTAATTAKRL